MQDWLRTGHAEIDRQHAELFGLVQHARRLAAPVRRQRGLPAFPLGLRLAIADFGRQAATHFSYEEGLMTRTGYADGAAHRVRHRGIRSGIIQLMEALDAGQAPVQLLDDALDAWFRHHVGTMDRVLVAHLAARASPPAA